MKSYTNADFGKDLKKSYQKPIKKRKTSNVSKSLTNQIYNTRGHFAGPAGANGRTGQGAGQAPFANSNSGGAMGGQSTTGLNDNQLMGMNLMKKNKKSKTKSSGKKKKSSMASPFKPVKVFNPKINTGVGNNVGTPKMGGTTQAQMNSAQANSKVLMKKNKKSKEKSAKKKTSEKKKKVSHVLQETSMCKECKTSHPKGKHSVKKKY